jgi:hypothetical protein
MHQPLLERSETGAYADMARAVALATKATYEGGQGSPPSVIAEVIVRAVAARRPKTRYAAGRLARLLLFMRRWLSDRAFDQLIMREVQTRQSR